jgi:hypothetical protein
MTTNEEYLLQLLRRCVKPLECLVGGYDVDAILNDVKQTIALADEPEPEIFPAGFIVNFATPWGLIEHDPNTNKVRYTGIGWRNGIEDKIVTDITDTPLGRVLRNYHESTLERALRTMNAQWREE